MEKEQIKQITKAHYRKLKFYHEQLIDGFEVEAIHRFRVEYKKLRAFIRMLSENSKKPVKAGISVKMRNTYRLAGAIRDLQLQHLLISKTVKKDTKKPIEYIHQLQKKINELKPTLITIEPKTLVTRSLKKTEAFIPDRLAGKGIRKYVQSQWKAVHRIIVSAHFSDADIHTTRKIIKDLFYNMKTSQSIKEDILAGSIWKTNRPEFYKNIMDELGVFQDKSVEISLMKSNCVNRKYRYERSQLDRIRKIWVKDKNRMKQSLVQKLKAGILQDKLPLI